MVSSSDQLRKSARSPSLSNEWPTWALVVIIPALWLVLVTQQDRVPLGLVDAALAVVVAWYMSLQHELLHGHPSRFASLNRCLGLLPLAVWYPYDIYGQSHLAHHREAQLTYPGIDPESNYLAPAAFDRLPGWLQPLQSANRTVVGRMVLGPLFAIWHIAMRIRLAAKARDWPELRIWFWHMLMLTGLLGALWHFCGFTPWRYLLGVAWPGLGLAMLRSFYEHRPATIAAHRIVINEAGWFWRLLYLNNNYHVVHHVLPDLPWYRIAADYRAKRAEYLQHNGGFLVPGYGYLLRRHAWRPIDNPVYPALRVGI